MNAAAIPWEAIQWRDQRGRRVSIAIGPAGITVMRPWRKRLRDLIVFASGKSNYLISKFLNQLFNAAAYSFPATLYAALWTSALSAASTGSTSGEAAYTGYARVAVTANTTNFPTSSSGAAITNATAITFPANGAAGTSTVTYFAILDAATTGNILYWGSVTSTTINQGDTPQVNISGLTVTET